MSLTRINNANAFTGTIPATNFANSTLDNITSLPNAPLGDMVFISSATASSSASIEFSLGSYKQYRFFLINIHPSSDSQAFEVNMSTDGGSNYNVAKTTTSFHGHLQEDNQFPELTYRTYADEAQETTDARLMHNVGADNDECGSGIFDIFNPSSTTFVKHFLFTSAITNKQPAAMNEFVGGYCNTTSAINSIRFRFESANIDDGKILMFGIN